MIWRAMRQVSDLLYRQFVEEDVLRRVHPEPLHLPVETSLHDAPKRLDDRTIRLKDLLQLGHDFATFVDFKNPLSLCQQPIEFGVGIA